MRESFILAHFNRYGEAVRNYEMTKREFQALERTLLRLRPGAPMVVNPLAPPAEAASPSVFRHMEGLRQMDMAAFAYCLQVARRVYQTFPELVVCERQTRGYTEALKYWHKVVKDAFHKPDPLEMAEETVLRTDYEQRLRTQAEEDVRNDEELLARTRGGR